MEAIKAAAVPEVRRPMRIAIDFLWLAVASLLAGLMTALAAAALVMLLARPAHALEGPGDEAESLRGAVASVALESHFVSQYASLLALDGRKKRFGGDQRGSAP